MISQIQRLSSRPKPGGRRAGTHSALFVLPMSGSRINASGAFRDDNGKR
jgi:hypothetical protein